jgi:hypothetical protein
MCATTTPLSPDRPKASYQGVDTVEREAYHAPLTGFGDSNQLEAIYVGLANIPAVPDVQLTRRIRCYPQLQDCR